MDPISAGAAFGFINSAFKFSEFAVRLYEVGSENEVFVRLIQRVRKDLEETERVLHVESVKRKLSSTPGKLPWVMSAIHSTKQALDDIGRWVERVRADKEGYGTVSFENRVRWVFNDHEKLVNRSMELATCHQTLSTVLAYLSPLEEASAAAADAAPPSYDDATHFDDFLSPRQRKRKTTAETTKAGVDGVEKSAGISSSGA
ncbi:hypothetical protein K432DRAFT_295698 [Lepidopterella palustris CBS 459.81]|uniref:Fungal N-terminal domain-containing protein n=1 Tax=Lepidopterella palustris CBS 459.81 TaxID=1314670 RepID=A0A8E2ECQ5_9PEZI|nr:hypothetical protein K432DRAFT_295698 [Lepidopterella palustris CBS 459.81]